MQRLIAYLPVFLLALTIMALLFATAADRKRQLAGFIGGCARMFRGGFGFGLGSGSGGAGVKRWFSLQRVVSWCVVLFLLSYLWTYQRVQDAIAAQLLESGVEEVAVGSLIIPYSAFFRSAYTADAGFSRSKKRIRAEVAIHGHPWSGFAAQMDEAGLAAMNKITGKKFVFSYLTDVKILRPAINRYMDQLVRGKQIDKYEIETFDNRGPYLIVALNQKSRGKDMKTVATSLAKGLHINLTQTNQLKVNQVVVKVVEPEPYLSGNTITVIGRGTAGSY